MMLQCSSLNLARKGAGSPGATSRSLPHRCCNPYPFRCSSRSQPPFHSTFTVRVSSEKEVESADVRRFNVMGMEVIESDASLPEPQADFWTGDKMEGVNTMMKAYIPLIFVAALLCGGLAARFFNDGASVYIRPATSDEALPETFYETPDGFVPAEENPLFK